MAAGLWITVRTVGGRLDRWPGLLNAVARLAGLRTRLHLDGRRRGDVRLFLLLSAGLEAALMLIQVARAS